MPALGGDTEALAGLAAGEDDATVNAFSRWRATHRRALLIVDQFEELFTLNSTETQAACANLLRQLALEHDVHVVLSMRDDFLMGCHRFEGLRPVVSDLTLLDPPSGANLRRALVQPATRCGYRFEDDELVEEMLAEVEGERGALPMLAFAAARLWEMRDRENGVLTRRAYRDIGGVGGALAKHAGATMDRIGADRIPIVRELFRNLVTSEGTRAVREWDELLSVFEETQRENAEEVLRTLIDARLLTSYEIREEDEKPTRRVEIIHESLLEKWPRLVRWSTQDADAAQLRDELRHAAIQWDQHGRADDRLWTGSAFREFSLWRERYPGGLTEVESAFAEAMTGLATRQRRRRRIAVAAAFVVLLAVMGIVTTSRQRAVAEATRAEAAHLLALAQLDLDDDPTTALAFTTASLGLADTREARHLAVEALWRGPTAFVLPVESDPSNLMYAEFSRDGHWLAASNWSELFLWSESGDSAGVALWPPGALVGGVSFGFGSSGDVLVAGSALRFWAWSIPGLQRIRMYDLAEGVSVEDRRQSVRFFSNDSNLVFSCQGTSHLVWSWRLEDAEPQILGSLETQDLTDLSVDPQGRYLALARGNEVRLRPLDALEPSNSDRLLGRHARDVQRILFSPAGDKLVSLDESGEAQVWSLDSKLRGPVGTIRGIEGPFLSFDPSGSLLLEERTRSNVIWNLEGPPDAEPLPTFAPMSFPIHRVTFHPSGRWLAAAADQEMLFWQLGRGYPRTMIGRGGDLAFSGDGSALVSADQGSVYLWPVSLPNAPITGVVWDRGDIFYDAAADSTGNRILVAEQGAKLGRAVLLDITGDEIIESDLWPPLRSVVGSVAFSPDDRYCAAGAGYGNDEQMVIRVWDLEGGQEWTFPLRDRPGTETDRAVSILRFTSDGSLLSSGFGGVRRWNIASGVGDWMVRTSEDVAMPMDADRDGRFLLTAERPTAFSNDAFNLMFHDLGTGQSRRITSHGRSVNCLALDRSGMTVSTGDADGVVRIGPADGSEPHLLFGHRDVVTAVAISPNGRWIASSGADNTIRLWPMPDLSKPPLHTLPYEQLIAKLKSLTDTFEWCGTRSPTPDGNRSSDRFRAGPPCRSGDMTASWPWQPSRIRNAKTEPDGRKNRCGQWAVRASNLSSLNVEMCSQDGCTTNPPADSS